MVLIPKTNMIASFKVGGLALRKLTMGFTGLIIFPFFKKESNNVSIFCK